MGRVLYVILSNIDNNNSGPSVRSLSILNAFKRINGNELDVIKGKNSRERYEQLKRLIKKGQIYDFCYIESRVGVTRYLDTKLLLALKQKLKINKIGIYYRDMYWNYNIFFSENKLRNMLIPIANKLYLKFLASICDVFFVQSESFKRALRNFLPTTTQIELLPPGCENIKVSHSEAPETMEAIYVGEIDPIFSGVDLLIETFKIINQRQKLCLNLVCRENEYKINLDLQKANNMYDWLKISHHTKSNIGEVYNRADVAIIPRSGNEYTKLCLPVKLFEYISYERPVIAVNHGEVSQFISKTGIGVVTNDNPVDFANSILNIINSKKKYMEVVTNIKKLKQKSTWEQRVIDIKKILS